MAGPSVFFFFFLTELYTSGSCQSFQKFQTQKLKWNISRYTWSLYSKRTAIIGSTIFISKTVVSPFLKALMWQVNISHHSGYIQGQCASGIFVKGGQNGKRIILISLYLVFQKFQKTTCQHQQKCHIIQKMLHLIHSKIIDSQNGVRWKGP